MSKSYKYGVSFNCVLVEGEEVGGGHEIDTPTLDYVSNSLRKVLAVVKKETQGKVSSKNDGYLVKGFIEEAEVVKTIIDRDGDAICVIMKGEFVLPKIVS